jgi:hypothetical protein
MTLTVLAALLEPDEVTRFNAGQMTLDQMAGIAMSRLPGGGQFAVPRLTRAMGIRLAPDVVEKFFSSLSAAGYDPFGLFDILGSVNPREQASPIPQQETGYQAPAQIGWYGEGQRGY